jgi:hypothetical protein
MPAATNSMKARPHRSCPIRRTISGTMMSRAMVMRFGIVIRLGWLWTVWDSGIRGMAPGALALRKAEPYCAGMVEERL